MNSEMVPLKGRTARTLPDTAIAYYSSNTDRRLVRSECVRLAELRDTRYTRITLVSALNYALILIAYFAIGIAFFSALNGWFWFDSFYLCVMTLTTVGYGDAHPTSSTEKLFICFYTFLGLILLTISLSGLADYLFQLKSEARKIAQSKVIEAENKYLTPSDHMTELNSSYSISNPLYSCHEGMCNKLGCLLGLPRDAVFDLVKGIASSAAIVIGILLIGIIFFGYIVDSFSFIDALYISCMTAFTVGYGDVTPTNIHSKVFSMIYALVGTAAAASALATLGNTVMNYKQAKREHDALSRKLVLEDLIAMDSDQSNSVSRDEFIVFKLLRMGLVEKEHVSEIEQQFNRLDVDGNGVLNAADVQIFQERLRKQLLNQHTRCRHQSSTI